MHKGNLPQFKRHKAFGQYKNRTAAYNPVSIVLHFAVAPVQLLILGIKIPPCHF
jgi:hypothetical protein